MRKNMDFLSNVKKRNSKTSKPFIKIESVNSWWTNWLSQGTFPSQEQKVLFLPSGDFMKFVFPNWKILNSPYVSSFNLVMSTLLHLYLIFFSELSSLTCRFSSRSFSACSILSICCWDDATPPGVTCLSFPWLELSWPRSEGGPPPGCWWCESGRKLLFPWWPCWLLWCLSSVYRWWPAPSAWWEFRSEPWWSSWGVTPRLKPSHRASLAVSSLMVSLWSRMVSLCCTRLSLRWRIVALASSLAPLQPAGGALWWLDPPGPAVGKQEGSALAGTGVQMKRGWSP